MTRFYSFVALIFFALSIDAQTSSVTDAKPATKTSTSSASSLASSDKGSAKTRAKDEPLVKIGNVPVPPEKARAINIPKTGPTSITIDGHVNEEAWQKAAVFKDFYQTSPGDNIAPS